VPHDLPTPPAAAASKKGTSQMTEPAQRDATEEEAVPAQADGYFACIAFMGHNEYTGYVTEVVKHGQPAFHVDLPEKLWGGNPLAFVEYAATAWFSERPLTEVSVRKAWEAAQQRAAERARQEAEWRRADEQCALTGGGGGGEAWSGDTADGGPF
jgi:hypothetical protein